MSAERKDCTPYTIQSVFLTHQQNIKPGGGVNVEVDKGNVSLVVPHLGEYTILFNSFWNPGESLIKVQISIRRSMHSQEVCSRRKTVPLMDQSFNSDTPGCTFTVISDSTTVCIDCRFFKMTFEFLSVVSRSRANENVVVVPLVINPPSALIPRPAAGPDILSGDLLKDLIQRGVVRMHPRYTHDYLYINL